MRRSKKTEGVDFERVWANIESDLDATPVDYVAAPPLDAQSKSGAFAVTKGFAVALVLVAGPLLAVRLLSTEPSLEPATSIPANTTVPTPDLATITSILGTAVDDVGGFLSGDHLDVAGNDWEIQIVRPGEFTPPQDRSPIAPTTWSLSYGILYEYQGTIHVHVECGGHLISFRLLSLVDGQGGLDEAVGSISLLVERVAGSVPCGNPSQ